MDEKPPKDFNLVKTLGKYVFAVVSATLTVAVASHIPIRIAGVGGYGAFRACVSRTLLVQATVCRGRTVVVSRTV